MDQEINITWTASNSAALVPTQPLIVDQKILSAITLPGKDLDDKVELTCHASGFGWSSQGTLGVTREEVPTTGTEITTEEITTKDTTFTLEVVEDTVTETQTFLPFETYDLFTEESFTTHAVEDSNNLGLLFGESEFEQQDEDIVVTTEQTLNQFTVQLDFQEVFKTEDFTPSTSELFKSESQKELGFTHKLIDEYDNDFTNHSSSFTLNYDERTIDTTYDQLLDDYVFQYEYERFMMKNTPDQYPTTTDKPAVKKDKDVKASFVVLQTSSAVANFEREEIVLTDADAIDAVYVQRNDRKGESDDLHISEQPLKQTYEDNLVNVKMAMVKPLTKSSGKAQSSELKILCISMLILLNLISNTP